MTSAARLAVATWVGAIIVGLLHVLAVDIYGTDLAWSVRLARDAFHVVSCAGLGALLAIIPTLWAKLVAPRYQALWWLVVAAGAMLAAWLLLAETIDRLAVVTAWQFGLAADGGANTLGFEAAYVAVAGLLVPSAWLVGDRAGRRRWSALLVIVGVSALMFVQPRIHRDDRDELHALVTWFAAIAIGACVGPMLSRRWLTSRITLAVLAGTVGLTLAWSPSNQLRLALFRDPGAAPAWVLAQTVWRPIDDEDAQPDAVVAAPDAAPAPAVTPPVVVLVTIDAMRADVLATRRYDSELPSLARLRDEGLYSPHAVAPSAQTAVSLTSMFTGRYYSSLRWTPHGTGWYRSTYPVDEPTTRFPELLTAAGVRTSSVLTPPFIASRYGIARGFARETVLSAEHATGAVSTVGIARELAAVGATEPAFIYAHLMDAHEPYDRGVRRTGSAFERYVSELSLVDRRVGRVLDMVRARFPDRGYLIVAADHGEAFGEHGRRFHSGTLYEEMIAVPLIVWGPGIAAQVRAERASLVDIAPTVLALFGVRVPPAMEGHSLLAASRGPRVVASETRLKRALITSDSLKVIEDLRHRTVEVYDLESDPEERRNLWNSADTRTRRLLATLRAFFHARANATPGYEPPYRR